MEACPFKYRLQRASVFSPWHTVHSLLVDWRHKEADRRNHCFVSRAVQNLPLEGLRVVEECTLISSVNSDLKQKENSGSVGQWSSWYITKCHCCLIFLTSCCLKSQTAWTGSLPLMGVVGLRGFSWMMDLALLFSPDATVLNSFSCSFSSCSKQFNWNINHCPSL